MICKTSQQSITIDRIQKWHRRQTTNYIKKCLSKHVHHNTVKKIRMTFDDWGSINDCIITGTIRTTKRRHTNHTQKMLLYTDRKENYEGMRLRLKCHDEVAWILTSFSLKEVNNDEKEVSQTSYVISRVNGCFRSRNIRIVKKVKHSRDKEVCGQNMEIHGQTHFRS